MGEISILERAANVRQKMRELKATVEELRRIDRADTDWTRLAQAGEDAENIAIQGLSSAWTMIDRLQSIALAALKAKQEPTP